MSVADFREGLAYYVQESAPKLDKEAVLSAIEGEEDAGQAAFEDDQIGREVVQIHHGGKKVANRKPEHFTINKDVTIFTKKITRTKNNPAGDSFNVLNFRRLHKEKKGGAKPKPYDWNCYEKLAPAILEAVVFILIKMEMPKVPMSLPHPDKLETEEHDIDGKIVKHMDLRKYTEPQYVYIHFYLNSKRKNITIIFIALCFRFNKDMSCEITSDTRVFTKTEFGESQLFIRKYKNPDTLKKNECPHFQFNIPATAMKSLALSLRYYIALRGLGPANPSLDNTTLAPYRKHPIVRELMCSELELEKEEEELQHKDKNDDAVTSSSATTKTPATANDDDSKLVEEVLEDDEDDDMDDLVPPIRKRIRRIAG